MKKHELARRPLLLGVGASAAGLLLPSQAQAFVWAQAGRYVGGLVLEWAVVKALDYFWDEATNKRSAILPHISDDPDRVAFSPFAEKSDTHLRFGNRMAQGRPRDSKNFFDIRRDFFRALRETSVDPADVIRFWGAPTSSAMGRPLQDGGELSGQFFSMHKTRYVVVRTFGGHAQMLPILNNKWTRLAQQIVNQEVGIEEAKKIPPLLTLIESPSDFVFQDSWKPG